MPSKFYTQEIINRVITSAVAAGKASQRGEITMQLGEDTSAQELRLRQGGYCARFVRQIFETACGFEPHAWRYAAASALEMTAMLDRDGHKIDDGSLLPGDILGIHKNSGDHGHVAIFVGKINGKDTIAENTSSDGRGVPTRRGTKLTPYEDLVYRVTGVYRLLHGAPEARWPRFRSFLYIGQQCREIVPIPNGDHRMDLGKVYWKLRD